MTDAAKVFVPEFAGILDKPEPGIWFLFSPKGTWYSLLTESDGSLPKIPDISDFDQTNLEPSNLFYIGTLADQPCFAGTIDDDSPLTDDYQLTEARSLFGIMDQGTEEALARARGITFWNMTNKYCSRCGTGFTTESTEPLKKCPSCGFTAYPRITPAVIILIRKGETILLAHNRRFPANLYSCVAGFVEAGESLEDAAKREIMEETGIQVGGLNYFGSQPWPFPNSLMVAFLADWTGGEIKLEDDDISDAKWFSRDNLPELPMKGSISRMMIDWFINGD